MDGWETYTHQASLSIYASCTHIVTNSLHSSVTPFLSAEVPNRTLMSRATQQHPDALSAYEVQVCHAFDWDISSALRSEGVI